MSLVDGIGKEEFATGAGIVGLCFFLERFPEKKVSRKGAALHAVAHWRLF